MDTNHQQFATGSSPASIFPLLWLHGEDFPTIEREIVAIHEMGCDGFVIESRPHPDYLGNQWWEDVTFCLKTAQQLGLKVWLFDEKMYPSGVAGGLVVKARPDLSLQVLTQRSYIVSGPQNHYQRNVRGFTRDWTDLVTAVAVPVLADGILDGQHMVDLRPYIEASSRTMTWAVPDGDWRLIFAGTQPQWSGRSVGECIDWLNPEAVETFIALTYDATWEHLQPYFGNTLLGFFGDETSFENFAGYESLFGEETPAMPWTKHLLTLFEETKGYDISPHLAALWWDLGSSTNTVRYDYMDVLTQQFSRAFFQRIQTWCADHDVQFIGHLVEDNGAHARHGYGPGHFFRMMQGFDIGGYDLVAQVSPGQTEGPLHWGPWRWDAGFFYWSLARLARSSSHLQHGTATTMSEAFGAYGWGLGLRNMFWITNWMLVRGTTWFVPHAFSPLFPDPDCPPHFFANGENPQWPWMARWSTHVHRIGQMLDGGTHIAPLAVLYPAEAEWFGDTPLLDQVGEVLAKAHYDFDIVPMDLLNDVDCSLSDGKLHIQNEAFLGLVVPGLSSLNAQVAEFLAACVRSGVKVWYVESIPDRNWHGEDGLVQNAVHQSLLEGASCCPLEELAPDVASAISSDVTVRHFPLLQHYHVRRDHTEIYFLFNESTEDTISQWISLTGTGQVEIWNSDTGTASEAPCYQSQENSTQLFLHLEPGESTLVTIDAESSPVRPYLVSMDGENVHRMENGGIRLWSETGGLHTWTWNTGKVGQVTFPTPPPVHPLLGPWHLNKSSDDTLTIDTLQDWEQWFPAYSGSITYRTTFICRPWADEIVLHLGDVWDIAKVAINGHRLEAKFSPTYQWIVTPWITSEENVLEVTVTNTLGNRFREDLFTKDTPIRSGLYGPVSLQYWNTETILIDQ